MKSLFLTVLLALTIPQASLAEDRYTLGWGRLFANDALGDGEDRWRTGSYSVSLLKGLRWRGVLPSVPGEILEYRIAASIVAPDNLAAPDPDDRLYAGTISAGLATHFEMRGFQTTLGGGLSVIGPSTGLSSFQREVHDLLGFPSLAEGASEMADQVHPYFDVEVVRYLPINETLALRPFMAASIGTEDLARVGGDLILGQFGRQDLLLRDAATGLPYHGVRGGTGPQTSFILGGDVTRVFDSVYLPDDGATPALAWRERLRAGLSWEGNQSGVFAGLSWLGPEFSGQPEGQVLGALNLSMRF